MKRSAIQKMCLYGVSHLFIGAICTVASVFIAIPWQCQVPTLKEWDECIVKIDEQHVAIWHFRRSLGRELVAWQVVGNEYRDHAMLRHKVVHNCISECEFSNDMDYFEDLFSEYWSIKDQLDKIRVADIRGFPIPSFYCEYEIVFLHPSSLETAISTRYALPIPVICDSENSWQLLPSVLPILPKWNGLLASIAFYAILTTIIHVARALCGRVAR